MEYIKISFAALNWIYSKPHRLLQKLNSTLMLRSIRDNPALNSARLSCVEICDTLMSRALWDWEFSKVHAETVSLIEMHKLSMLTSMSSNIDLDAKLFIFEMQIFKVLFIYFVGDCWNDVSALSIQILHFPQSGTTLTQCL